MTNIQFEEDSQFRQFQQPNKRKPLFIRLVLATGVVKTDRQAEYILLGIAVIGILITASVLFSSTANDGAKPLPYEATYKPTK